MMNDVFIPGYMWSFVKQRRETDRQTESDRQTDRQAGRETETERDKERQRQAERERERERERETALCLSFASTTFCLLMFTATKLRTVY